MKDFPQATLSPFEVEAQTPDEFVLDLLDLAPGEIVSVLNAQVASLRNPPMTRDQVLDRLFNVGLIRSVTKLRELMA